MLKFQSSSYKFEFFVMDITIPQHYQATHCYISLVSDQFEEMLTRKCRVIDCISDIEATLKPKMVLSLNRRSSQYHPPFVKLQVYISSSNNPNSHLVIGSLTFDLLEQLVNPNQKDIREQLAGTDVRIRLSISSYPCEDQLNQTKLLSTSTNSVLKEIQNIDSQHIEFHNKPQGYGNFLKQKQRIQIKHSVIPAINFMETECLDFSDILPDNNNMSKLNDSTSFDYNRNKDIYQELVKLNEQFLKLKEQNNGLLNENQQLREINNDLDDVNNRLSRDLKEADEKIVRLQKQISVYVHKINSVDIVKMEILSQSENDKKNAAEIEMRNLQIMKYVNELQENELRLNCTIAEREEEIEELKRRADESDNKSRSGSEENVSELSITLKGFGEVLNKWKNGMELTNQKQIQGLVKSLKRRQRSGQVFGRSFIVQQLEKTKVELNQLKREYLFKSEISIINLISSKLEFLLNLI